MSDILTDEQMADVRNVAAYTVDGVAIDVVLLKLLLAHYDAIMAEIVKRIKNEIIESRGMEGTIRAFAHQNCLRIIADMEAGKNTGALRRVK